MFVSVKLSVFLSIAEVPKSAKDPCSKMSTADG